MEETPAPEAPAVVDKKAAQEQKILSRALSLAESNRFSDAKRVLRRLGPVEELSPAAVDLLIRIYTSEDRLDKAELVWRFAKGHGQIEGDTYDPALYKLGKQPEPAAAPAEAEAAAPPVEETPAPEAPAVVDKKAAQEQKILSRALSLAESNRFSDAKRVLRRLGPVEELSPAAVDLLIRIYTSEDRLDKAELVWRFAKGHGQIEGDTYDPALYKLGKQPEPAAAPAEAEAAAPPVEETPAPEELAAEGEADRPFGRADRPGDASRGAPLGRQGDRLVPRRAPFAGIIGLSQCGGWRHGRTGPESTGGPPARQRRTVAAGHRDRVRRQPALAAGARLRHSRGGRAARHRRGDHGSRLRLDGERRIDVDAHIDLHLPGGRAVVGGRHGHDPHFWGARRRCGVGIAASILAGTSRDARHADRVALLVRGRERDWLTGPATATVTCDTTVVQGPEAGRRLALDGV